MAAGRRIALGSRGEDVAVAWYRQASYEVVARNWRCPDGEIDVVVRSPSGDAIVFCEVKTRTSDRFGSPFEAVTPAKQRRLRLLAARWLRSGHGVTGVPGAARIRFDVAAVTPGPDGALRVEVLEDAF